MRTHFIIVLIFISVYGLSLRAKNISNSNVLKLNADVTVKSTKEWVAGTRLWFAVNIKNINQKQITGPILEYSPFDFYGHSYELRDPKSEKRIVGEEYSMPPYMDMLIDVDGQPAGMEMPSAFKINSQENLRLLFPIAWPVEVNPNSGEYELNLIIYGLIGELGRTNFKITIRHPTEDEIQILNALDLKEGKWASVKENITNIQLPDSLQKNTGLAFELLLSNLSIKHDAVSEISEKELPSDIPALFSPEIDVIRYEILKSKQLNKEANELRSNLLVKHPGIRFRLDDIDNSMGIMARIIKDKAAERRAKLKK